ncbi:glutaredoxin family protein [Synechococcus sp. MIT S1220]|uniref:glutaredoxin family protein n=1 Tax=Synechococcus sp. MIT S1220 TaxID=3082549 RepID=UPI0039AEDC0B
MAELRLYSRQGCCLCEGLEQRLRMLDLTKMDLHLKIVDIDAPTTAEAVRARYDLEVPVLAVADRVLPRVSPRLSGDQLQRWLLNCLVVSGG